MIYQPMLELLAYLRANGFKTFIVSGGGIEFMRPWAEQVYGIPPEQVIGSSVKSRRAMTEGATLIAPDTVFLAYDARIGRDVVSSRTSSSAPGVTIEDGAIIRAFSHLEGARMSPRAPSSARSRA